MASVIIATDLGDLAPIGYRYGELFAAALELSVALVHVDESAELKLPGGEELLAQYREDVRAMQLRAIGDASADLAARSIRVEYTELCEGPVWRQVLRVAHEQGGQLVIASKPTDSRIAGSTALRLARHSDVPLLIVDAASETRAPEAIDVGRLIVPLDLSDHTAKALVPALELGRAFGADVVAAHVLSQQIQPSLVSSEGFEAATHLQAALGQRAEQRLQAIAGGTDSVLLSGSVAHALDAFADQPDDMFVVSSHGRGALTAVLLGSTTETLLRATRRPVLIYPRRALP
ncbi:MAG: universal stress protein [Myxococcales bacterium]|nr:universal stress protein [Myxococcales bacterium]